MLMRTLWSYWQGYVIIKVKGAAIEEFLNLAAGRGIYLWDTERLSPNMLVARVSIDGFRALSDIVRAVPVQVRILQRVGFPFLLQKIRRRQTLLLGGLLSLLCIYFASSFLWFIQIEGVQKLDEELILQVLTEVGVKPGIRRSQLQPHQLEKHLMLEIPELAWVGVSLRGTLLQVRVVEKTGVEEEKLVAGDIVAARDGLITQVVPFVGTPVVQEGETVHRGQVLISGDPALGRQLQVTPEVIRVDTAGGGSERVYLRADGIVKARVWYEGHGEASSVRYREELTGKSTIGYRLQVGSFHWQWGCKGPPFARYKVEETVRHLEWSRLRVRLPVVIRRIVYHEVNVHQELVDADRVKQMAVNEAWKDIRLRRAKDAEILSQNVDLSVEEQGRELLVQAKITVEVHENIGVFRPLGKKP